FLRPRPCRRLAAGADRRAARGVGPRARCALDSVCSPPPLAAELGFTRVRPRISWPKSDISDFGWRDREGGMQQDWRLYAPSPPLPRKRGREQTEIAARFLLQCQR